MVIIINLIFSFFHSNIYLLISLETIIFIYILKSIKQYLFTHYIKSTQH